MPPPPPDDDQPGHLPPAVGGVPALQGHPHQEGLCGDPDPENHIRYSAPLPVAHKPSRQVVGGWKPTCDE